MGGLTKNKKILLFSCFLMFYAISNMFRKKLLVGGCLSKIKINLISCFVKVNKAK